MPDKSDHRVTWDELLQHGDVSFYREDAAQKALDKYPQTHEPLLER